MTKLLLVEEKSKLHYRNQSTVAAKAKLHENVLAVV